MGVMSVMSVGVMGVMSTNVMGVMSVMSMCNGCNGCNRVWVLGCWSSDQVSVVVCPLSYLRVLASNCCVIDTCVTRTTVL